MAPVEVLMQDPCPLDLPVLLSVAHVGRVLDGWNTGPFTNFPHFGNSN